MAFHLSSLFYYLESGLTLKVVGTPLKDVAYIGMCFIRVSHRHHFSEEL